MQGVSRVEEDDDGIFSLFSLVLGGVGEGEGEEHETMSVVVVD